MTGRVDRAAPNRGAAPAGRPGAARHYLPGGRENGGGIGRLAGYVIDAAAEHGSHHALTDTRGPRWHPLASPVRLVGAALVMAHDRIAAPHCIHHIHVAGRGSTMRKLMLAAAARALGCRHVLHLHDYDYAADFERRPPWLRPLVRRMFRGADGVIALGQRDRRTLVDLLGVDAGRVAVLHNCVPDPGARPVLPDDVPTILFVGRLSERKGVPELLAALGSPLMAGLPWRAVLAGDGPLALYRQQAAALGLAHRVAIPGWLGAPEIRALCARSDILALPSHAEGMAMAVLEGLAHGLAVVTTRVGAHEEAITHEATGLFIPPGDPGALAAALARLVSEPALRRRLAAAGRALYLSRFGIRPYLHQLQDLYGGVAARRHPATLSETRRT